MTSDTPDPDPSDDKRLLSGKRQSPRRRQAVAVRCVGVAGCAFKGRTVDISRGGALVEITDPAFLPVEERGELIAFAARVGTMFPEGIGIYFADGSVQARGVVVRLEARQGRAPHVLMGCKFDAPLADLDCGLLGLDNSGDETKQPPAPVRKDRPHATSAARARA